MTEDIRSDASKSRLDTAQSAPGSIALVRAYLGSGAAEDAIECCRRMIAADPRCKGEAQLLLAESLRLSGRIEEATRALDEISESLESHLESERTLIKARIMVETGRYSECIERFGEHQDLPARCNADIVLRGLLAESYTRLKDLSAARSLFELTISESEKLGWPEGVANGLMSLALLDRIDGHWPRAEGLLLKARETYSRLGLSSQYIRATLNLGLQRLWRGHLSFAEEALREATRLAVEMANTGLESISRTDRGLALVRLNRLNEARQELAQALRLCRRQASPRRVAIALEYTGEYHLTTGNYPRATAALRRALNIANRIAPEGDIVPEVRRRQAEVALGLEKAEEALEIARDAEERASRLGDRYERATALRVQGQALSELGRDKEASDTLRHALTILEDLGETFERDRILHLLGEPEEEQLCVAESQQATGDSTSKSTFTSSDAHRLLRRYGMIGKSRALIDLMRETAHIAPLEIPVLIQGETGTGKELLAHAIHKLSKRPKGRMVAFNCATCPADLLDAELFGHEKGAFTGANANRLGLVRSAQGGTLFLDEIGEMREESQARLLRLLDSGEVRPLGSDKTVRVNVRIVAATHADLEDRIRQQQFRRDLYFRLAGIRLVLPPLRHRPGDLRELVEHFVNEARQKIRPGFAGFSELTLRKMENYDWPGNIRQLRLEVHRHAALAHDGVAVTQWTPSSEDQLVWDQLDPEEASATLKDAARLRQFMLDTPGTTQHLARVLGCSRSHLYRTLRRHGISIADLKDRR